MINVDAAMKKGKNAMAMVVRDCVGGIIAVATCGATSLLAEIAELKTLLGQWTWSSNTSGRTSFGNVMLGM